jgi:hypothetical protein
LSFDKVSTVGKRLRLSVKKVGRVKINIRHINIPDPKVEGTMTEILVKIEFTE